MWNFTATPDLYLHEEGYYVVRFHDVKDINEILFSGPYIIRNRPIILKPWTPAFDFSQEFMTEIPLWVKFLKLPMSCWECGSLGRIASALGKPLFANECTTKQTRISYARMLIEVNVSKPLPEKITVMDPNGQIFQQEVEFEWKPQLCPQCLTIGHIFSKKKPEQHLMKRQIQNKRRGEQKKVVQEWKPKEVPSTSQTIDKQQLDHLEVVQPRVTINEGKLQQQEADSQIQVVTPYGTVRNASKGKEKVPSSELNLINFPQSSTAMASKSKTGKILYMQREDQRTRQAKPPDLRGNTTSQ
uniref:DUF4283 domain-containing protein n=1 Tax=Nicotiana tabacum TaxID=4097 RepID=A0A1S3ZHX5_TOBAC|nr:PREDICTED: uncharacterized protein LOC107786925 [Nicotiana tabacum]